MGGRSGHTGLAGCEGECEELHGDDIPENTMDDDKDVLGGQKNRPEKGIHLPSKHDISLL